MSNENPDPFLVGMREVGGGMAKLARGGYGIFLEPGVVKINQILAQHNKRKREHPTWKQDDLEAGFRKDMFDTWAFLLLRVAIVEMVGILTLNLLHTEAGMGLMAVGILDMTTALIASRGAEKIFEGDK